MATKKSKKPTGQRAKAIRHEIRNIEVELGRLREPGRYDRRRYQFLHGKKERLYREMHGRLTERDLG